MVRVTLKNTFLSFDEAEEDDEEVNDFPRVCPKQAASPRSRSLDCPSDYRVAEEHGQIRKLNSILDSNSSLASPALGPSGSPKRASSPGGCSIGSPADTGVIEGLSQLPDAEPPMPSPTPPRRSSTRTGGAAASSANDACGSSEALPSQSLPFGSAGPSAQELRQLQRRLEEACQGRHGRRRGSEDGSPTVGAQGCKVSHVASACSVSTMANESSEESEEVHQLPQLSGSALHQVRSTNSVCSMASEQVEESVELNCDGETIEFDLTIEEGPQAERHNEREHEGCRGQASDAPWVRPPRSVASPRRSRCGSEASAAAGEGSRCASPGSASPPGSGSPAGGSPRCRMYSPPNSPKQTSPRNGRVCSGTNSPKQVSPRDSRFSQWRPLPKEYRHGHVPKNLDLAEEYKNADHAAPPTTLMIRNIPNRYTQRELIMELEDLGFASTFDFLYIPLDKGTMSNVGYAFVNFVDPLWAERCMAAFQNYRFKRHRKISGKIAAISVAHIQGLEANLAHYENAAVNTAKLKQRRPVIMANISQSLSGALLDES